MDDNPQVPQTPPTVNPPQGMAGPATVAPMAPAGYPRPDMAGVAASPEERSHGMLVWVLAIVASFFGVPWLPPLIFFFVDKDKPFVYRHAVMALTLCILSFVVAVILIITVVGWLLLPVVGIVELIFCIMGAIAANKGESYDPPGVASLAKSMFKV